MRNILIIGGSKGGSENSKYQLEEGNKCYNISRTECQ